MRLEPSSPSDQARAEPAASALQRMLGQCTELLQRQLPPLVDAALQRVDDALYEFADKSESDRSYAIYFEAQRRLRHERANLKRRFLRNLTDTVLLFQDAAHTLDLTPDTSFDSDDLQLLGDKDLEESLVLTNMISKAETRYLRALLDLARHFAQLLGRPALRQRDLPVGPTAIANAFAAALRGIEDLDLSTVLVVHKIFDQQVMDRLDGFYKACVEFAHTQGLRPPARKHEIIKSEDPVRARPTPPLPATAGLSTREPAVPAASWAGDWHQRAGTEQARVHAGVDVDPFRVRSAAGPGDATPATTTSLFDTLRQMLAGARQAPADGPASATLPTLDLIELLSRVQPEAAHRAVDEALTPNALRDTVGARLRASIDPKLPRRLAPTDEDTMDLVFLLFEQILAGGDIPDPIKVLVSRLQIPYVKVALMDRGFFDDADHPARRLLNRIGAASIGWNEGDREQDGGLYALIEHLVARVVTELHTDPGLFEILERELAAHSTAVEQRVAAAEQRIVRQAAARNVRQSARRRARALLDARADDIAAVPPVVRTILEQGWLEAMMHAHVADGADRHWRLGERVLTDLLWSVAPKQDAAERRELLRRIPELLRDLRACLAPAIPDQQLVARWLKELQTVHIAALRGQADVEPVPVRAPARAKLPTALGDGGDADALPIGCWLGLTRDDGSYHRFKLAWRGDAGDPLLLVDRLGQKGFELPKPELEALLAQDLADVIGTGEVPVVDRAFEAVRQSLRVH